MREVKTRREMRSWGGLIYNDHNEEEEVLVVVAYACMQARDKAYVRREEGGE